MKLAELFFDSDGVMQVVQSIDLATDYAGEAGEDGEYEEYDGGGASC